MMKKQVCGEMKCRPHTHTHTCAHMHTHTYTLFPKEYIYVCINLDLKIYFQVKGQVQHLWKPLFSKPSTLWLWRTLNCMELHGLLANQGRTRSSALGIRMCAHLHLGVSKCFLHFYCPISEQFKIIQN